MLTGRRAYPVVLVAGVLLTLAFPEPDLAPVAWFALVPLLLALRGSSPGRGALLGFVFGVGFFATVLYWISIVGYVAWAVLVVLEAGFVAAFGALAAVCFRRTSALENTIAAVALWVAMEFFRSLVPVGGLTWGELAQSQHNLAWMLRPAALGGGWLVSGVVVAINTLVALALGRSLDRMSRARLLVAAAALVVVPVALPANEATGDELTVSIVQGSVPQDFAGSYFEKELAITRSHIDLTQELAGGDRPDLVVWPESSVGLDLTRSPELADEVTGVADTIGVPMIVGGNIDVDAERYKVVAYEITPTEGITDIYTKTHLVPFGEYVPGRKILGWIPMLDQVPRDAVAGAEHKVFEIDGHEIATVISFEGDFGSLVRRPIDAGGRLLVVATNTSTWGYTWASAQHEAFSQVRAAENGVWVVHAALSGISAFIRPDGTVVAETELYEPDTLSSPVRMADSVTLYARIGDWFPLTCIALSLVCCALGWKRSNEESGPSGQDTFVAADSVA